MDFIAGRYEAGQEEEKVVVKRKKQVYTNIKWGNNMTDPKGGAVQYAREFINDKSYKDSVKSTLCYGVQWDAVMQFFDPNYITQNCDPKSYVRNSTNKGNYGVSGDYYNIIPTGSNESFKEKNIYDMAGNVWECTMESYINGNEKRRAYRGGQVGMDASNYPASVRSASPADLISKCYGFRITLYL